jgi:hypothetical protein
LGKIRLEGKDRRFGKKIQFLPQSWVAIPSAGDKLLYFTGIRKFQLRRTGMVRVEVTVAAHDCGPQGANAIGLVPCGGHLCCYLNLSDSEPRRRTDQQRPLLPARLVPFTLGERPWVGMPRSVWGVVLF